MEGEIAYGGVRDGGMERGNLYFFGASMFFHEAGSVNGLFFGVGEGGDSMDFFSRRAERRLGWSNLIYISSMRGYASGVAICMSVVWSLRFFRECHLA